MCGGNDLTEILTVGHANLNYELQFSTQLTSLSLSLSLSLRWAWEKTMVGGERWRGGLCYICIFHGQPLRLLCFLTITTEGFRQQNQFKAISKIQTCTSFFYKQHQSLLQYSGLWGALLFPISMLTCNVPYIYDAIKGRHFRWGVYGSWNL